MMRHFLLLFLVAFLSAFASAGELASKVPMVAVMPFTGRALDSDALETIAATLATNLLNTGKFRVMERSQMESILKEQDFQQSGACDGSECAVEVGKLLSVDHMVVGTVGKVGGTYVVNARLVSVQTGEVLKSTTQTSRAEVDAIVTDLLPRLAQDLSGRASASVTMPSAPAAAVSSNLDGNHFTDARDGQVYKFVTIGNQTWMAQNLNYADAGVCYDNSPSNCAKYGRLYTWSEVMAGAPSSVFVPRGVQGICPSGWHVPSDAEWGALLAYAGTDSVRLKLSSTSGWSNSDNGTDVYGFNVLPAGNHSYNGTFVNIGIGTFFWSSTESSMNFAWDRSLSVGHLGVERHNGNYKTYGFSLRCLQN